MLNVERPQFGAKETYLRCISSVKDVSDKKRLTAAAGRIDDAAAKYAKAATAGELHLISPTHDVAGLVSRDEMIAIYERRMARQGSPGRHFYDALLALPDGGTCPFCAQGTVSTLDHVLPKSRFCELTVTPDNLVGACRDCNHAKSSTAPNSPAEVPIHPYFDDVSGARWLDARVVEGGVAALVFEVVVVDSWSHELNQRVKHQFDMLGLGRVYAVHAANEISLHKLSMARLLEESGPQAVERELRCRQVSSGKLGVNRWQTVTFRTLAGNEWYCAGGFRGE